MIYNNLICLSVLLLLATPVSYAIPKNAHAIGGSWFCNTGYKRQGEGCKKLYVPPNARVIGSAWYCNNGFKRQGNQCNRFFVPKNARVIGSAWYCNNGFRRQGNQCNKINPPQNARVLGSSWYCNPGFKRQGNACKRITAPKNARILGSSWYCNTAYRREGNQCIPLEQQATIIEPVRSVANRPLTNKNDTLHSHGAREHSHPYPAKQGVQHQHGKNGLKGKASNNLTGARATTITYQKATPTLPRVIPTATLMPTVPLIPAPLASTPLMPKAPLISTKALMPRPLIPTTTSNNYQLSRRSYICSELSDSEATALYLAGHTYLDRDNDGLPCEPYPNPYVRPEAPTRSYRSNCHYVSGYTRSNGTYVRGHNRCR